VLHLHLGETSRATDTLKENSEPPRVDTVLLLNQNRLGSYQVSIKTSEVARRHSRLHRTDRAFHLAPLNLELATRDISDLSKSGLTQIGVRGGCRAGGA